MIASIYYLQSTMSSVHDIQYLPSRVQLWSLMGEQRGAGGAGTPEQLIAAGYRSRHSDTSDSHIKFTYTQSSTISDLS